MSSDSVLDNVRASAVVRARRLLQHNFRIKDGAFLAEGPQAVREAALAGLVRDLFVTTEAHSRYLDICQSVSEQGGRVLVSTPEVLTQLSSTQAPQGMAAVVSTWSNSVEEVLHSESHLAVACYAMRDPGNAGAVIRVADAVGADGVLLSHDSVEVFNPKVVRASVGSLFHLPIVQDANIFSAMTDAQSRGMQVLVADASGVNLYTEVDLSKPTMWVFGNEAWGVPQDIRAQATQTVSIPIFGKAESLNLATAAAVCLYATAQHQHAVR